MADHAAEQILAAVHTTLDGLATTGSNIERDRIYPVAAFPALSVNMGPDEAEEIDLAFVTRELNIEILVHVQQATGYSSTLNQVKKEVHQAMMANRQQGLPALVLDTWPAGDDKPELSDEGEVPAMVCTMNWVIHYRHTLTDASV